jgi:hypothetical protein
MGLIMALPVAENTALPTLEYDHLVVRFSCSSIARQPYLPLIPQTVVNAIYGVDTHMNMDLGTSTPTSTFPMVASTGSGLSV